MVLERKESGRPLMAKVVLRRLLLSPEVVPRLRKIRDVFFKIGQSHVITISQSEA